MTKEPVPFESWGNDEPDPPERGIRVPVGIAAGLAVSSITA